MRDPIRIDRILTKLGEVWRLAPDLRLGQLLLNLHRFSKNPSDVFNTEDDQWEVELDNAKIKFQNTLEMRQDD